MSSSEEEGAPTKIELVITFDSEEEAEMVYRSLQVDDDRFIETKLDGNVVKGVVTARSVEGARRAADDWLACLMSITKRDQ